MTKQQKKTKPAWQIKVINGVKALTPFCPEAEKTLEKYHVNQVLAGSVAGTRKYRSLKQNNLYFSACGFFLEKMSPDVRWRTKDMVDKWFRNKLQYYDLDKTIVLPDRIIFELRPLNFIGCEHAEATGYYTAAFQEMADIIGVDVDVFIEEVKREMG